MSSASKSPHGFAAVRGRGYRPRQVDAFVRELSDDRDAAWERAARLTVLARHMEAELAELRETVARQGEQTYESLGEGARRLYQLGRQEAQAVREGARAEADRVVEEARAYADEVLRAAREHADAVRAEADERARHRLLAARAEADELRISVRREVKACRGEALSALREVRQRTSGMLTEQAREHAERLAGAERAQAEWEEAAEADLQARIAAAETALTEAARALADAEAFARRAPDLGRARAAEVLADARLRAERISQETERVLREHGEMWDDVREQMDTVQSSITALTGRPWAP
ncbi:cellulose-binding protein [Streptomyces naganishii]|uniref:Cellulose-binding protein n=1 Tax=Streptomyces naganishii JCM 4654 TaxID=1306179 RepID=A0A918YAJ4_9ACTN|nr:cellulose-binding protein [Streptomyces naganishii]GHD95721.1 hypothetical protein GCM10010508_61560 [Streptomyces naganishii JCM 4654]